MNTRTPLALCMTMLLAACVSFGGDRHAQELNDSRLDDDYCTSHGLRYPDPAYEDCRWSLEESRLRRQWRNAQMLKQASQPTQGTLPAPGDTLAPSHRPQDRAYFHCHPEPQFGTAYVFCGFDAPPPG